NTFTLRGTASDDNELVGVRVTITNTDTDEVFDGYQATVDKATNTWSFVANRRGGDGAFELPDGNYQVIARAVDGANRQTVASTTLEIDNTAPVLVLNRPGTKGPLASTNPEVYGSELRLTGSANDDHALDLLTMRVYSAGGTLIGEPLTYANVSGVGMDILLAKHYETPADEEQQALRDRYLSIYNAAAGGTQEFYCLVDISDYAREYEPPADVASADNTRGNVSRAYWLYDDIYSRVFDKSGFALTMSDLTSVLSGRYASVTTAEEVKTYLAENQQDSTVWSETAVTFSLDPENSPYYEVIGYTALATSETITAQASNGTNLTVRVSAGRDRKPLRPETIRVFLDPSNANGAELAGDGDNLLLLPSVAELGGDAAAIAVRNEQLSKTGDDYVISVNVGTLVNGNYYLVKVEGEDQAGYEITDAKGKYGFQIIASGNPPVLTVTAPEDLSYWNGDSVFFEGTVDAEGGLASLTANVTITATSGGTIVRNTEPQTITIIPVAENPDTWSFTLDTVTGILTSGLYMAEVYIEAADLQNKRTPQIIRLYIDKDPPRAEITRVEPYYFYDSGTGTYTINGTVAVTLSMTDNDQLVSLAYDIGTIVTQPETPVSTPVDNRTLSVNTSSILVPANLPVTVTLQDRAGNNATISLPDTLYVDQSTDKPVIELSNPVSLAADQAGAQGNWITGSVISGTITDDDAIGSLQLNIYNTGGTIVKTRLFTAGDLIGADRRKVLSYDISVADANPALADGIYRLSLTAFDDSAVASDVMEGWFSYDTTNPELIDVDTTPPGLTLTNTGFTLSGDGYDANALRSTNPVVVKQRLGSGEKIPVPVAITVVDDQNCTWTIENLPRVPTLAGIGGPVALDGSNDGLYEYEITVFDQAGQFSVETVQVRL
ncbi:MAG TPA: hypothetical protein PLV73_12070, partial [Treponemataceae bacterium]|nr:hypothetical protein [Treponemataceae bacterium]